MFWCEVGYRLAVFTVLNCCEDDFFCLLACVCTSFSAINQGTARRTPLNPWGDLDRPHVVVLGLHITCFDVCCVMFWCGGYSGCNVQG